MVKSSPLCSYLIFYIKDEKQIVVEKSGDRNAKYDGFLQDLFSAGPDDCRYGVFDSEYDHQTQGTATTSLKQKLILMSWYDWSLRAVLNDKSENHFGARILMYCELSVLQVSRHCENQEENVVFKQF